jgi:hypothetical protein
MRRRGRIDNARPDFFHEDRSGEAAGFGDITGSTPKDAIAVICPAEVPLSVAG